MARWILPCPQCKKDFNPSDLKSEYTPDNPFAWLGIKPKLPEGGLLLECPNCNESSVFVQQQLRYR